MLTYEDSPVPGIGNDSNTWYSLVRIGIDTPREWVWPGFGLPWLWVSSAYLVDLTEQPEPSEPLHPEFRLGPLFQSEDGSILPYNIINTYGSTIGYQSWLPDLEAYGHNGVDLVAVPTIVDAPCKDGIEGRRVIAPVDGDMKISNPDVWKCDENGNNCTAGRDPATNPAGTTLTINQIPGYPELEVQLTHVYAHQAAGPIQAGSLLGYYAQIGYSSTPHLHVTIKWSDNVSDPTPYLP